MLIAAASIAWTPRTLFARSEQGGWYDPSDISTLWQDNARTTPVTAAGQTVGAIDDKSGRGNHALQATTSKRPAYQIDGTGRPYLNFDGVDDFMVTAAFAAGTDALQCCIGFEKITSAGLVTRFLIQSSPSSFTNNGSFAMILDIAGSGAGSRSRNRSRGFSLVEQGALQIEQSGLFVWQQESEMSPSTLDSIVNLSPTGLTNTTSQGATNYGTWETSLGGNTAGASLFSGKMYGAVLRYGANPGLGSRALLARWMALKTGVSF